MALIETTTFRLRADVEEAAFLEADRRVQTECVPTHPGFLRRTTARGDHGEWVVVTLWASPADADASAGLLADDDVMVGFLELLEPGSSTTGRYTTLD